MEDILLYQTSDSEFAARIITALKKAGISCCQKGVGWSFNSTRRVFDNGISIFIHDMNSYHHANSILLQLGAYVEPPLKLPRSKFTLFMIGAGITATVFFIIKIAASN